MQRTDTGQSDDERGPGASLSARLIRRSRAIVRFALRRLQQMRAALTFAVVLAGVGLALFSPLLLDDLAFRASYLLRPSQDAVTITDPLVISEQPRLTVASGTLSVPPALSGQARTGEALAALLKGGSARLALKQPVIHLELSPQPLEENPGGLGWTLPALQLPLMAASPLTTALEEAAFETLTVRDGTVHLKSEGGRVDTLENVSADITVKRKTAVRIKGSFRLLGELMTVDATLGARIGRGGSSRMPLKAQLQSGLLNLNIDGRIDLGQGVQLIAPSAEVSIPNIRSVARWLGHVWPSGAGLKNFAARGSAEWTGQTIAYQKGRFEIDGNEGNGALSLNFSGARPAIAGTLAFQDADLSPYLPADGTPATGGSASIGKSLIAQLKASRDLTLPLIGALDADLRISAENLSLGWFKAGRNAASLALHDGQLLLNLADMALPGGGSAEGELTISGEATAPNYTAHGRIDDVELTDVTAFVAGTPMLKGKGQVQFDFKAGGRAGMDLLSRLNGRIDLALPDGAAATCTIRELASMAASEAQDGCRTTTTLAPFKAMAITTNGVVAFDRVEAMSGSNRMRFDGNVDLVTSVMRLNVTSIAPTSAVTVQGEPPPESQPSREVIFIDGRPDEARIAVQPK